LTSNEISCQNWQSFVLILRELIFDRYILALDVACFLQAQTERSQKIWIVIGRPAPEKSDYRHGPLRPRRERPKGARCSRTANKPNELASFHVPAARATSPNLNSLAFCDWAASEKWLTTRSDVARTAIKSLSTEVAYLILLDTPSKCSHIGHSVVRLP